MGKQRRPWRMSSVAVSHSCGGQDSDPSLCRGLSFSGKLVPPVLTKRHCNAKAVPLNGVHDRAPVHAGRSHAVTPRGSGFLLGDFTMAVMGTVCWRGGGSSRVQRRDATPMVMSCLQRPIGGR